MSNITDTQDCQQETATISDGHFAVNHSAAAPVAPGETVAHSVETTRTYPRLERQKRGQIFAIRFVRLLFQSFAIERIGHHAALLVLHVAHTEDAARYSGPVTFWNGQLMQTLGFSSPKQLNQARANATEAGWLHYERNGTRAVGNYWVLIPPDVARFNDAPIEEPQSIHSPGGTNTGTNPELILSPLGTNCGTNQPLILSPGGKPSTLLNTPNPKKARRGAAAVDDSIPESLNTPEFQAAWRDFEMHRQQARKPLTPMARKCQLKKLAGWGPDRAVAAIYHSLSNSWQSIHERDPERTNGTANPAARPAQALQQLQPPKRKERTQ